MRKISRQILLICLVALVPALASAWLHPRRPSWDPEKLLPGEVLLSTVLEWKKDILWVDARSRKAFEGSHVPGAKLLNEDEWSALLPPVLGEWKVGRPVVVYCDSSQCNSSRDVAKRLREMGIGAVFVLKGGWQVLKEKMRGAPGSTLND